MATSSSAIRGRNAPSELRVDRRADAGDAAAPARPAGACGSAAKLRNRFSREPPVLGRRSVRDSTGRLISWACAASTSQRHAVRRSVDGSNVTEMPSTPSTEQTDNADAADQRRGSPPAGQESPCMTPSTDATPHPSRSGPGFAAPLHRGCRCRRDCGHRVLARSSGAQAPVKVARSRPAGMHGTAGYTAFRSTARTSSRLLPEGSSSSPLPASAVVGTFELFDAA